MIVDPLFAGRDAAAGFRAGRLNILPVDILSISTNGEKPDSAIVWAHTSAVGNGPGKLMAFGAMPGPVAPERVEEIWGSETCAGDAIESGSTFAPPTVSNGRVYVAAGDRVDVFGLVPGRPCANTPQPEASEHLMNFWVAFLGQALTSIANGATLVRQAQMNKEMNTMLHPNAWIHRASRCLGIAVAAASLAAFAATAAARPADGPCQSEKQLNVAAKMRDGVTLYADVYHPKLAGSYPVILMRLPYNKDAAQTYVYAPPQFYASHCYIVVIQDVRGQYTSEGSFYAFRDEAKDGYDTIEWAAKLPGANGKVGMYGFSYVGATQWMPATLKPPSLVTIVPAMTSSDYYDGWSYEGGAWSLAFEESWPLVTIALTGARRLGDQAAIDRMNEAVRDLWATYKFLPIKDYPWLSPDRPKVAPYFYDWIKHDTWDDYWKQWSIRTRYNQVQVPALNFSGWYDVFMNGAIENFVGMRAKGGSDVARKGQKLVVGPWIHLPWEQKVGEVDFGPEATNPVDELQLRWFDHWLKGKSNGVGNEPAVRVFVMGANKWRTAEDWPIPGTQFTEYYLHSGGAANTRYGNGWLTTQKPAADQLPDRYRYDPANPVPSKGGHSCCTADTAPVGPFDQSEIQNRADVLVYTTPPLEKPVEVTGPITVTLYAASSAKDTDFTAKLTDVHPDGKAILLNNGILRASFRKSLEKPEPIEPGKIYAYDISIWPTSNLFKAGHRIRLEISSSNFPHYDRNPNTGRRFGMDTELAVADQIIYHDAEHPSKVVLPIMVQPIEP